MTKAQILKLDGKDFLKALNIKDVVSYYISAKRSRIFDKQPENLSECDWVIDEIKNAIKENGLPTNVKYYQNNTPSDVISRMARTEREYDYVKGEGVILVYGKREFKVNDASHCDWD